jgi:hypothetical protein
MRQDPSRSFRTGFGFSITGNKHRQGKDLKKEHKIAIFGGQREKSLPVLKATEEKDSRP